MPPCTKRLEAVVLCRAQGDSEWSDWPGEIATKRSLPIQMSSPPTQPVSETNCYIHTKQTRTHLSGSSLYLFGARKPPEKMSISQVAEFFTPVSQRTRLTSLTTTSKTSKLKNEIWKGRNAMQCNSGCLHCSFSRSQSTWPHDRALMGHAPSQISWLQLLLGATLRLHEKYPEVDFRVQWWLKFPVGNHLLNPGRFVQRRWMVRLLPISKRLAGSSLWRAFPSNSWNRNGTF